MLFFSIANCVHFVVATTIRCERRLSEMAIPVMAHVVPRSEIENPIFIYFIWLYRILTQRRNMRILQQDGRFGNEFTVRARIGRNDTAPTDV